MATKKDKEELELMIWTDDTERLNKWLTGKVNALAGEGSRTDGMGTDWLEIRKVLPEFKRKLIENGFIFRPYKK